jgi:hypothetical protein
MPITEVGSDLVGYWGPSTGFPMSAPYSVAIDPSAATACKVTFVNPREYDVEITLDDLTPDPDIELARLEKTVTVLGDFDVTSTVSMQGRTVRSGVPLTLTDVDGAPTYSPHMTTSTTDLAFNVLFEGVNGGIYEITTNQPRYLNVTADLDKQFLVNGDYEIESLELKGGNAFWGEDIGGTWVYNNEINIGDASRIGSNYNQSPFLEDADVNFDGKVNIQDLALVGGNYGLTSTDAYADWLSASPWNGVYPTSAPATLVAPESGVQEIYTAEEFAWILSQTDMFPTGVHTIRLMKDIDLNNYPWTPSGGLASGSAVAGDIFDGNGHTIYNLRVIEEERAGLFVGDNGEEPIVQNLVIDGAYIEATPTDTNIQALAAVVNVGIDGGTSFSNVIVRNATVKATKYAAIISAYSSGLDGDGGYFTNCTVEDSTLDVQEMPEGTGVDKPHVGGIVGLMNKGTFTGNTVTNLTITIHPAAGFIAVQTERVGALIGTAQAGVSPKDPDFAPVNTISNVTYNGAAFTDLIGLDNR